MNTFQKFIIILISVFIILFGLNCFINYQQLKSLESANTSLLTIQKNLNSNDFSGIETELSGINSSLTLFYYQSFHVDSPYSSIQKPRKIKVVPKPEVLEKLGIVK